MAQTPPRKPPRAEQRPSKTVLHGIERNDPYAWLRDDNWQEVMRDPGKLRQDIRDYLEAENQYTLSVLDATERLQQQLFDEMKGRIKEDDSSVPAKDGPWEYFVRYEVGGQHPRYCRRASGTEVDEEILFDADAASKNHAYFQVGSVSHSPQHDMLAFAVDDAGSEFYKVAFKQLASGQLLDDRLGDTAGGVVWANDGKCVFYTVLDEHHRPCKVYRHRMGSTQSEDELVYEEKDPGFFVGVGVTENRQHIVIDAHDHTTSEAYLLDANALDSELRRIAERRRDVEYEVCQQGDTLFIRTNADGAEDFKIVRAPAQDPRPENWQDEVPHRPGCLILDILAFEAYLVRLEREGGLPRIVIRERDGDEHTIDLQEETYSLGLVPGYEYATDTLRFTYSSLTTPQQVYDYSMRTRTRRLRKQQEVPSGHDAAKYRSKRIFATSHDGEKVPVSLLWHQDTPTDGSAPVLLYGYGSYGHAIPTSFGTSRLSLVDRGFIWAIAHVRGGTDKGYAWYRRGKLMSKKNTFEDFVAAAQHLCDEAWCKPGNITIHGGSAGGMLVGATVNLRPELFKAVLAEVPFVDVLTTMSDASLPLTPPEWPEWGNPIESEEAYRYIASYSPYDNVKAKPCPHILATGGLTDPRVTYWEPAKWVARLRERNTSENLILLKTYMEAGHGGSAGRFEKLKEVALVYGFVLLVHGRV